MYPEEFVRPMREELTRVGFRELRSAQDWLAHGAEHPKVPPTGLQAEYILASRTAAIMLPGSATPLPAMSNAVP